MRQSLGPFLEAAGNPWPCVTEGHCGAVLSEKSYGWRAKGQGSQKSQSPADYEQWWRNPGKNLEMTFWVLSAQVVPVLRLLDHMRMSKR